MLHEPAGPSGPDHASSYKTRLGVWMFLVYCVIYAAFVAINILKPEWMGKVVFAGLNLAVVYGMGLIVFALLLALHYNRKCTRQEERMAAAHAEETR